MATLNAEYINPFLMAAKKILHDMCFVEVKIQKPTLREASFGPDMWVIMIGVTGEMRGQVMLVFTKEDACRIASKMCMTEITEINDFSASALSELGNMVMGNAATVFSSKGIGIDITPPVLSHGQLNFMGSYAKSLCVPLEIPDGHIDLFLAVRPEE